MLKRLLLSALLLVVPACVSEPAPAQVAPTGPAKVMIIGDSIALGLGNMGATTDCPVTAEYSSLRGSFGVRVADALGVDYVMFAWPGVGLVRNYGDDQTNTLSIRMGKPDQVKKLDAAGPIQLILINIGTHDFYQNDPATTFIPAMENLLTQLAGRYPDATIYALTGPMLGDLDKIYHDNAVSLAVDAVNAEKGTHIRYLALDGGDRSVAFGCAWHPSVPAHEHMADMILDDLKAHE